MTQGYGSEYHRQCPRCGTVECPTTDVWSIDEDRGTKEVEYTCETCGLIFLQREQLGQVKRNDG